NRRAPQHHDWTSVSAIRRTAHRPPNLTTRYRRSPPTKIRYFTFGIFTILPFACESFGSFTTVTYNSFSPSLNATFVVPSPAAISNICRSLPSGDSFKILPPNHWATKMLPLLSTFMLSGPIHQDSTLFGVRRLSRAKFDLLLNEPSS